MSSDKPQRGNGPNTMIIVGVALAVLPYVLALFLGPMSPGVPPMTIVGGLLVIFGFLWRIARGVERST